MTLIAYPQGWAAQHLRAFTSTTTPKQPKHKGFDYVFTTEPRRRLVVM
jgi:hypothetical protein